MVAALLACLLPMACDDRDSGERGEAASPDSPISSQGERPNVVIILTDDQDVASLDAMPTVRKRIGGKGVTFPNAFVTTPLCCPSRASLITGQYTHNHGVRENLPPRGGYVNFNADRTLATWLNEAGYRTGWIGKFMNGYGNPGAGTDPLEVPPGWDEWRVPVKHTEFQMFGFTLNENGALRRYGHRPRDYQTDVLSRHARRFVAGAAAEQDPFFLIVATLAPHTEGVLDEDPQAPRNPRPAPRHDGAFASTPLPTPPSFNEADVSDKPKLPDRLGPEAVEDLERSYRSRLESLLAVDDLTRRLINELRRTGQLGRTLIVFTSDQGYQLGEHRLTNKYGPYDESVRVPFLVRGPGIPRGVERPAVVANIDLAPTIVEAAAAVPDLEMDGVSLRPVLEDPEGGANRSILLEQFYGRGFAAVQDERWVYIRRDGGARELYDLRLDPHQLHNLADRPDQQRRAKRYSRRLKELRDCAGTECR
jgi:N-acetylglucosamine-6-sulfatase